tara:strand:+ start:450 stop:644 length:195 start_codon:yes stop_codon:yes gene_type:complete
MHVQDLDKRSTRKLLKQARVFKGQEKRDRDGRLMAALGSTTEQHARAGRDLPRFEPGGSRQARG